MRRIEPLSGILHVYIYNTFVNQCNFVYVCVFLFFIHNFEWVGTQRLLEKTIEIIKYMYGYEEV